MKIKLDENVPARLATVFEEHGHDAVTVRDEGLTGQCDSVVWEAVQPENRLFVTMDLDFSDIRRYPPGTHAGVLILRPARLGRSAVKALVELLLSRTLLDDLTGCLAVADEQTVRVRRP